MAKKGQHSSPKTEFKKGNVGWNKGKKGLQIAWNKGIPMREETRLKLKKPKNEKTKRKMSEAMKGRKRKPFSNITILKMSGKNNHNWLGGISKEKKTERQYLMLLREYKFWRMKVFLRDNFTCQYCGERGCFLEAHHIKSWDKYPELRFEVSNGITLCKGCHKKIHFHSFPENKNIATNTAKNIIM